ncbi:FeoB-associated Cys-rich membrane protein [Clostridium chauvoei]|uniref:FeoB-associated Cys-rich membrane protein n=2 Tax=Clostridium chauvoei TaxID=46867 RepID=S6EQ53_9CLOT|nr:FeoB-associated Cys-rich membrane protein [Clostridium chauvoei]ATD54746.1 hypothetical protein BTM20_05635 [Clostridium chauvoei]ATD57573.1 hypothetical protein BTM21_07420 [Clostridium chauvoei]MBX7280046.1 FeoB-associated Cys-rich membrane protein [Clostridium chauvoei]MBX7282295.1 FeoB-associated Cys-rich membrane protein [Clostridium chauvoei]MBX7284937.1 FeoB-associated Cys-rich membrane protein [Clostridium chauvoei]
MEIIITVGIIAFSAFVIYKKLKKSSKGECTCGSCSSHCPMYKNKEEIKINKK